MKLSIPIEDLKIARGFCASDLSRPPLNYIQVTVGSNENEKILLVATDSFRLCKVATDVKGDGLNPYQELYIPMLEAERAVKQARLEKSLIAFVEAVPDVKFPKWYGIIPSTSDVDSSTCSSCKFSADLLSDTLKLLKGKNVTVSMTGERKPTVITGGNVYAIIMPVSS